MKLVGDGDLQLGELYGSWAGAFGQTQFIPSTYQRLAVDFDGDGRCDLVRSVADALGSTANYLKHSGRQGPGFLVFGNFDAIYSYNPAESYALAISHLADRLAGHPPLRTPWPTDDPGLTRAERRHLQQLLLVNGYHIGEPDGKIGPVTRAAIADAERRFGMPPTGRAGQRSTARSAAGKGPGGPSAPSTPPGSSGKRFRSPRRYPSGDP